MKKVHKYDYFHYEKIPNDIKTDVLSNGHPTICGYVRKNVTNENNKVTCKLCLKEINKR